jgi:hypothetical protein
MSRPTIVDDLEVVVRGELPADVADYARERISALGSRVAEPVFHTRIRLTHAPNPGYDRPVLAQANLTLKGRMVRAQVAGFNGYEAVDRLRERLQGLLERSNRHWEARRGGRPEPEPGEWRHDEQPSQRPPYYPRPMDDRQVIRHKSFTPKRVSPDEAAWEMDQLDYDFHLFTDNDTARDAVVYRDGPTGYRMQRLGAGPEPAPGNPQVTLNPHAPARLSLDDAQQALEIGGLPFVFFVDRATDRGAVLYHRYDGHYGLIVPAG